MLSPPARSFPADYHLAVLNKANKVTDTEKADKDNDNNELVPLQQKHRIGTINNKLTRCACVRACVCVIPVRATLTRGSAVVYKHCILIGMNFIYVDFNDEYFCGFYRSVNSGKSLTSL